LKTNKNDYEKIVELINLNEKSFLIIFLNDNIYAKTGEKMLLGRNFDVLYGCFIENHKKDIMINSIKRELEILPELFIGTIEFTVENEKIILFVQEFAPKEKLYIFGAGHVAEALCKLLQFFKFNVTVLDDRQDLLSKFTEYGVHTICSEFSELNNHVTVTDRDYVVIVTRGHIYDKETLEKIIDFNPKYVGMIGSKKRVAAVKSLLGKSGFDEAKLNRIFAPIGLPIAHSEVEEIALAILSEIIAVKNNKTEILKLSCH